MGSDRANGPKATVLDGLSEGLSPEGANVGFGAPNSANLISPVKRYRGTTNAVRERSDAIRGSYWYSVHLDVPETVSISTLSDGNMVLSLGGVLQDEHGAVQGILVRTIRGNIIMAPKIIENLIVALLEFGKILQDAIGAPYDCLWVKYVLGLRDRLPDDQYETFRKFYGSPKMVLSILGLENREFNPPKALNNQVSFTYSPLSSGDIRLIIVLPSPDATATVECVLCHESLERQPSYEALSYVWGNTSNTRLIKVNGQDFNVTENLEIALRTLRHTTHGRFRVLWVDAICINQNNVDERNEQVKRMGNVYSSAQQVCVWLGKETNTDRLAIEFLHQLPALILGCRLEGAKEAKNLSLMDLVDPESTQNVIQDPSLFQKWEAICNLFARPWWRRVWVLQEILLAKEAFLYCGKLFVDWKVIIANCKILGANIPQLLLSNTGENSVTKNMLRMVWDCFKGAVTICHMRRRRHHDTLMQLLEVLEGARTSEATDPRDHVYGIMGLLRMDKVIIPDYKLSVTETYTHTAMFHMERSRTLDVLSFVEHWLQGPKKLLCLPSWVPDWSFQIGGVSWLGFFTVTDGEPVYNACLSRKSPLPFVFSYEYLREVGLYGFMVDTIEKTERVSIRDTTRNSVQNWRLSISESVDQSYFGLHSTLEAFWRTVFGDIFSERNISKRLGSRIGAIAKLPPSEEEEKLLYFYLDTGDNAGLNTCRHKRFFRTRTGRMGIGSISIKPGDIVVVLLGGFVPFILREAFDGRYFLVCDSYVHGIMDGEIVKEWNDSKRDVELFTLV